MYDFSAPLFYFKFVFLFEILVAETLLVYRVKRRPHFARRAAIAAAGLLLFTFAQTFQTQIQSMGISFPYELAVMLPYILVIVVLSFTSRNQTTAPTALGKPFNREMRT